MSAVAVPRNRPVADLAVSASALIAGHQFRFKAGVPGCSCGEQFKDSGELPPALHANHLAPLVVRQILRAAAAALREDLPADPADAAVSVLARILRQGSNPTDGRHDDGNA